MNWTIPYPCRSRSDSVRRINMSNEPGNESFFCGLRPILRILSLQREITRIKFFQLSPESDPAALSPCRVRKSWLTPRGRIRGRHRRDDHDAQCERHQVPTALPSTALAQVA